MEGRAWLEVYEQEYHWTLVTLYALEELERVDVLEMELRDNDRAFFAHWGFVKPTELERQRQRILRRIEGDAPTVAATMRADPTFFDEWPGSQHYRKPVS